MRHFAAIAAGTLVVAVAAAAGPLDSALGAPAAPSRGVAALAAAHDRGAVGRLTLVSGDQVVVTKDASGRSVASLANPDPKQPQSLLSYSTGGELYAIPARAVPDVVDGRLDRELFDISRQLQAHWADGQRSSTPVIMSYRSGTARPSVAPAGTTAAADLAVINATAAAVTRATARTAFWAWLHGRTTGFRGGVTRVWLDAPVHADLDVSAPAVGAPTAWAKHDDGRGVKVAVLDTGIDATHPDFAGRITAAKSFIPGEGTDDTFGHGTHVASILAGSGAADDGKYVGIAPRTSLLVGKVLDANGNGTNSQIIQGLQWAGQQGARVVNLSLGGAPSDGSDPLSQAVNSASTQYNMLVVAAAGNEHDPTHGGRPGDIESPGAAADALTVGGTIKYPDNPVDGSYSSVGPRLGDLSVKPEIVAPGTSIVAARAHDNNLGEPVDEYYQALTGTSMATPHVAGAAADLLTAHPDWTWLQVKDALVSSARALANTGVAAEGNGFLSITSALADPITMTGTANLGFFTAPGPGTASTSLTLSNASAQPVTVDLAMSLAKASADLRSQSAYRARAGTVAFDHPHPTVPAHGSTTVQLTVAVDHLPYGTYFDHVTATNAAHRTVATATVDWTRDYPRQTLFVRGFDRHGRPETSTEYSFFIVLDLDTGQIYPGYYQRGVGVLQDLGPDPALPADHYAVLGNIGDFEAEPPYALLGEAVGGNPQVDLTSSNQIVDIDASLARPVQIQTPLTTQNEGVELNFVREVRTAAGDAYVSGTFPTVDSGYLIAGAKATQGTFVTNINTRRTAPELTITSTSRGLTRLADPRYAQAAESFTLFSHCYGSVSCVTPFPRRSTAQVVDAGSGSAADLRRAHVDGKLALIRPPIDFYQGYIDSYVDAAAAAGAVGVLIPASHPDAPNYQFVDNTPAVPVAGVSYADGVAVDRALEAGPVLLTVANGYPVSYLYDLHYEQHQQLTGNPVFRSTAANTATVTAKFHADQPGQLLLGVRQLDYGLTFVPEEAIHAPQVRTEYLSANVNWSRDFFLETFDLARIERYAPGQHVTEEILSTPSAPGSVRGADELVVDDLGFFSFQLLTRGPDADEYQLPLDIPSSSHSTWYAPDGTKLCDGDLIGGCDTDGTPGVYRIVTQLAQDGRPVSTNTHTTWTVNITGAGRPQLTDLRVTAPVNLTQSVPAGRSYPITVVAGTQWASTPAHDFQVQGWVSVDDGHTWTNLGRPVATDQYGRAILAVPAQAAGSSVTLRVRAVGANGNSEDQTIDDAWKVG